MAFAEPGPMTAGLKVLERVTVAARMIGYQGSSAGLTALESEQLADLMDAVHNIPYLLANWERCDEALLVSMLKDYDAKWKGTLADVYARVRSGHAG